MPDTSDRHLARLHERLAESRVQVFALARAIKHDAAERPRLTGQLTDSGFPHSRLMRALMGKPAGIALGTAAVAATLLRPRWLTAALRLAPMLRPVLTRYLLPRLLGR